MKLKDISTVLYLSSPLQSHLIDNYSNTLKKFRLQTNNNKNELKDVSTKWKLSSPNKALLHQKSINNALTVETQNSKEKSPLRKLLKYILRNFVYELTTTK